MATFAIEFGGIGTEVRVDCPMLPIESQTGVADSGTSGTDAMRDPWPVATTIAAAKTSVQDATERLKNIAEGQASRKVKMKDAIRVLTKEGMRWRDSVAAYQALPSAFRYAVGRQNK
jgi:hypothetical protein